MHTHINTHMVLSLALTWQVVLTVFLPLIEFHFHVYETKFMLLALDLTEGQRVNEILHWSFPECRTRLHFPLRTIRLHETVDPGRCAFLLQPSSFTRGVQL